MIINRTVKPISSDQFQRNLNEMIAATDRDLETKPFILYNSTALENASLFTMGLWRYDLPELLFPQIDLDNSKTLDKILHTTTFMMDRYKSEEITEINVTELESLLTMANGVPVKISVKDTEEFFWGHGMPYRYYLGDEYKNVMVLEVTYSETLNESLL